LSSFLKLTRELLEKQKEKETARKEDQPSPSDPQDSL
jgi:hypothetical protein